MNEAPKGKIGRLTRAIQEQVNRRLENGEKGRSKARGWAMDGTIIGFGRPCRDWEEF
jgi:hypothetical protein